MVTGSLKWIKQNEIFELERVYSHLWKNSSPRRQQWCKRWESLHQTHHPVERKHHSDIIITVPPTPSPLYMNGHEWKGCSWWIYIKLLPYQDGTQWKLIFLICCFSYHQSLLYKLYKDFQSTFILLLKSFSDCSKQPFSRCLLSSQVFDSSIFIGSM